jgi:hypothetical protein
MPRRIQRRRERGWRLPVGAKCVDRSTIYGNPFEVGEVTPVTWPQPFGGVRVTGRAHAVDLLRRWIDSREDGSTSAFPGSRGYPTKRIIRKELQGLNLACWCPLSEPCHADLLIEIANPKEEE